MYQETEALKDERTILAILLYAESIKYDKYKDTFNRLPARMFSDIRMRQVYEIIQEEANGGNKFLVGTDRFREIIYSKIEDVNPLILPDLYALETYWFPAPTLNNFISKVQERYYISTIKEAKDIDTIQELINERNMLSISDDMSSISEDSQDALSIYDKRKDSAIFTPYKSVNQAIGSLQGGDMVVLAGSTGGGKTCFMLNLAIGIAKSGKSVDIFSLEMPKYQLNQRIICCETGIDAKKFRTFELTEQDRLTYKNYSETELSKLNINIYPKQTVSINELKRVVLKSKSDIVFIDYLGLINGYETKGTYEKFSNISRDVKLLAMASNKPIVALHQLNREFQSRDDKRPKLSDLRDSGKIEQDADMVWFVYRPAAFDENRPKKNMEFIVAKNRFGESNTTVPLDFFGETQKIKEKPYTFNIGVRIQDKIYNLGKTDNKEEPLKDNKIKKWEDLIASK